ncbi:hypothetical protein Goari_023843, partial [Gossypium aridum]|nr:hypothetical protein [Gossypium aridum]
DCLLLSLAIRSERNRRVHDKVVKSGKEITNFISRYLYELDCLEEKKITVQGDKVIWNPPPTDFIKVNFDTAFVMERCRLGTGQVAQDSKGVVIASKTCTTMWDRLSPGKPLHALRRLKCEALSARFQSIIFVHVKRSGNALADALATECVKKGEGFYLIGSAPESAATTFSNDWLREPD